MSAVRELSLVMSVEMDVAALQKAY